MNANIFFSEDRVVSIQTSQFRGQTELACCLCRLLATCYLTFLSLSFLICKMSFQAIDWQLALEPYAQRVCLPDPSVGVCVANGNDVKKGKSLSSSLIRLHFCVVPQFHQAEKTKS